MNNGSGDFTAGATIIYEVTEATDGYPGISSTAVGDFNSDGLFDVAVLPELNNSSGATSIVALPNSASAQATFTTAAQTLPSGVHTLTAAFPGDTNFAASTSVGVPVTVNQTTPTLTWSSPAAIEYGISLTGTQLNAVSSVPGNTTYTPVAGTILSPGTTQITAAFIPTDTFDYTSASASQPITVTAPSFNGIAPAMAKLGDPNTTITITGQGLVNGAVAKWNGTALATTSVDLNHLTAVIPASLLANVGTGTITVVDPGNVAVAGSQIFTIVAQPPTASVTSPPMVTADEPNTVTLSVGSYPVPVTATVTLAFTPAQANGAIDPTVLFTNNALTTPTDPTPIPANSATSIQPFSYQTGSTAGTITFTIQLTAGGTNVPPANPTTLVVTVPAGPPVITSTTLTRNGVNLTLAMIGFSTTREMTQAAFHFTPASGKSLKTTDITVPLATPFGAWYQTAESIKYGTMFTYTQPFTLDSDATDVASVTVTLSNSQGASQTSTAQ